MKSSLKIPYQVAGLQGPSAYEISELTHWLSINTSSTLDLVEETQSLNYKSSGLCRLKEKREIKEQEMNGFM